MKNRRHLHTSHKLGLDNMPIMPSPTVVLMKSGIPRIEDNPFKIPQVNAKRNSQRYLQITAVLREYIKLLFSTNAPHLEVSFSRLFAFMDGLYADSPQRYCAHITDLNNWFKVYVLSGSRAQGDIPQA